MKPKNRTLTEGNPTKLILLFAMPIFIGNLFQIFYTSKTRSADVKRGIGLGLTICETVVKAHGGTITGRNRTDGKGAEFLFTLPLTEGESESV